MQRLGLLPEVLPEIRLIDSMVGRGFLLIGTPGKRNLRVAHTTRNIAGNGGAAG